MKNCNNCKENFKEHELSSIFFPDNWCLSCIKKALEELKKLPEGKTE